MNPEETRLRAISEIPSTYGASEGVTVSRADLYAAFRAGASGLAVINRFTTRSPAADRLPSGGRDQ